MAAEEKGSSPTARPREEGRAQRTKLPGKQSWCPHRPAFLLGVGLYLLEEDEMGCNRWQETVTVPKHQA